MIQIQEIQAPVEQPVDTPEPDRHTSRKWKTTFWQFIRFCFVGGANTMIDLLILNGLLWLLPSANPITILLYNSIAYTTGALNSFFLNKYWTFQKKQRTTFAELIRFAIALSFGILCSNSIMWVAGKTLSPFISNITLWANASKLLAVGGSAFFSYAFMRLWTFAERSPKPQTQRG